MVMFSQQPEPKASKSEARSNRSLVLLLLMTMVFAFAAPASVAFAEGEDDESELTESKADDGETVKEDDKESSAQWAEISRRQAMLAGLTIFVLSIFVGFEMITKVPPTLHTPLMSGSNAISGITIVGAVIVAGSASGFAWFVGILAVILATVNVIGGFMVTHRMLAMFKR